MHQVREWHFPLCLAKSILGRRKLHLSVDKGDVSVLTDEVESDVCDDDILNTNIERICMSCVYITCYVIFKS